MWKIIESKLSSGKIEYQVSNGDVGKRTMSYDTFNKQEAIKILQEECANEWHKRIRKRNKRKLISIK